VQPWLTSRAVLLGSSLVNEQELVANNKGPNCRITSALPPVLSTMVVSMFVVSIMIRQAVKASGSEFRMGCTRFTKASLLGLRQYPWSGDWVVVEEMRL
jgi:hypothetical protein